MATWEWSGPIVAVVDGAAEQLGFVDYACLEATRSGAQLVLLAPHGVPPSDVAESNLQAAAGYARQRYGGLRIDAVCLEGSRRQVLQESARGARLLVVGRQSVPGPQRLVAAEAHLSLARRIGCPLAVVPQSWRPGFTDRHVAVGIDGTALSAEAVEFAMRTAAAREGDLIVVHAEPPRDATRCEEAEHPWITRADQVISEALGHWKNEFPKVGVTRFISSRPVAAALVRESEDVGLVVVGSHLGDGRASDPIARASVAAMTCPVTIVPHHPATADRA